MKTFIATLILYLNIQNIYAFELDIRPTDADLMRLPGYCTVKLRSKPDSPEWKVMRSKLGENFTDVHHYCFALNAVNRYWSSSKEKDRSYYLGRALTNFQYMISHEKPNFPYWGELYTNMGDVHKFTKNISEAMRSYNKAIEIDPSYARAYIMLAGIYRGNKAPDRALDIVTQGLRYNPDIKNLQRLYTELGGTLPYPTPIVPPPKVVAEDVKPEQQINPTATISSAEQSASLTSTTPTLAAPLIEPKVGSQKNPYCRFCPE